MGMDYEDCGVGVVGGRSRMGVERSKASGKGHLSGLGYGLLVAEEEHAIGKECVMDCRERRVVERCAEVNVEYVGTKDWRDRLDHHGWHGSSVDAATGPKTSFLRGSVVTRVDEMAGNNRIHHLAVASKDITSQIAFFNDVLGCEPVAVDWMHGVTVSGPLDHGICHSIYFAGRAWTDPEVVDLAGVSAEQLNRYRSPADFQPGESPVPQPAFDESKPYPRAVPFEQYKKTLAIPDEVFTARFSENIPPVLVHN